MYEIEIRRTPILKDENDVRVRCSRDILDVILPLFPVEESWREQCWAIFLDRARRPIGRFLVGIGGERAVTIDIKPICAAALNCLASGVILAHNHPSGNPMPGESDKKQTEALSAALSIFDIDLMDHIVLGEEEYFSFSDEVKSPIHPKNHKHCA
jgi:DNA repair protein RadC